MSKKIYNLVFLTVPAIGHINPMLPIMTELVKQGHQVIVYNNSEFETLIRETGAEFRLLPVRMEMPDLREFRDSLRIAEKSLDVTRTITSSLIKIFKKNKPDCIIHDSLGPWGKIISQYLKIPAITLVSTMAINSQVLFKSKIKKEVILELASKFKRALKIYGQFRKIYRQYGLKAPLIFDIFSNKENLNIAFTSRSFQIEASSFKSDYKFVGPSIYKRGKLFLKENFFKKKKKIVYISSGTIFNDDINFYRICSKIFRNADCQVFMSIGNYIKKSDLGKIPDNFYVKKYLPQLQILEKADLFITHGGMNSVNESLYYGVPMIIFPQMLEQKANAYRVEELGAGIVGKSKLTESILKKYVNIIYNNNSYRNNAIRLGKILKKSGGYKEATQLILDYTN